MLVCIRPDREAVAECAYRFVRDAMIEHVQKGLVLGLPTGGTPLPLYEALVAAYRDGELDFSSVHTFNLDEYVGLPPDHPQSYRHFMEENLFKHVNLRKENVHFLSGLPDDAKQHCLDYEEQIGELGGIDLQILGIGRDGHIGFNEPASSLGSRTRDKILTEATIQDNRRYFSREEDVPRWSLTMGVGTILEAARILVMATGSAKAEAISRMVEGPVTAMCTASALQMHPDVTLICDEDAAAKLQNTDYYRWIDENDPEMASVIEKAKERWESIE